MKYTVIMTLLILNIVQADIISVEPAPIKTCGTPQISQDNTSGKLEELKKNQPDLYQKLLVEVNRIEAFNRINQQQKLFWGYNFNTSQYYSLSATLRKTGDFTRIWVEDASWNVYVNDTVLNELMANLENYSGATSIDPNRGIVEIDTLLFGQPPNYDGDGIIDFLVLDIKDSFTPNVNNSAFIAGYFSPTDQTNLSYSNKMDLMYLDAYPGIYYQGIFSTERVLSTTAHEIQHLIHHNYDQDEELWVNEGLSQLAGTYCGYGLDFPQLYLDDTNQSLIEWGGEVKDYARVNLWTLYCAEQLGLSFIKNLVQNPQNGIAGFNQAMILTGNSGDINTVFSQWVLANTINSIAFDPRFGYQLPEARGLKAKMSHLTTVYPGITSGTIQNYATEYHRFRGQDSLTITFSGTIPSHYLTVSRLPFYRINFFAGNSYSSPSFTDDSTYVLILLSMGNSQAYRYDAFAKYSLRYYELAYDDNEANIKLSFQNVPAIAANRFVVPEAGLELESVSFWNGSTNNQVRVRVYDNQNNNLPGNDLVNPILADASSENAWITVDLPSPLQGLNQDQVLYVGIEINQSNKTIGYDSQRRPGLSYLNLGASWRPLSEYLVNNQPLDGLWMIRSVFTGLVLSDSIPPETLPGRIVLENNFPNPFSSFRDGTWIRYRVENPGRIQLQIYNSLGQKVANLSADAVGEIFWDGRGAAGPLAAGIYFFQLIFYDAITGKKLSSEFKKLVLLN